MLISSTALAHHEPRHDTDEKDELIENTEVEESESEDNTEVRHHVYMPYPLAYRQSAHPPQPFPLAYRQSAHPPQIQYIPRPSHPAFQYVPIYADPRFISLNLGAYSDLGFARYVISRILYAF